MCVCVCVRYLLSRVQLFVTPWAVALRGSSVHGILQARILEWVAVPSPRDLLNPGTARLKIFILLFVFVFYILFVWKVS